MKNHIKLLIAAILSISFSALFFFNSFKIPKVAVKLPRILMSLIVVLSIGIVLEGYIKKNNKLKSKNPKKQKNEKDEEVELGKINYMQVIIFTAMIAIYIMTMKPIGYFIMTPIYFIANYLFLKATNVRNIVLISAGFTAFVYFVFVVFLKLPIPMGLFQ